MLYGETCILRFIGYNCVLNSLNMVFMFKENKLSHEITKLLILKAFLVWFIWYICFSHPLDNHDEKAMTEATTSHFFNPSTVKGSQHD